MLNVFFLIDSDDMAKLGKLMRGRVAKPKDGDSDEHQHDSGTFTPVKDDSHE